MKLKNILFLVMGILIGATVVYLVVPKGQTPAETADSGEKQLYSCGMHPEVILEEPGDCPICGMKLTPIKGSGSQAPKEKGKILYWRAPMDPTEIYDKPGKSRMGMDLVPVYEGEEAGGAGSITINGAVQQNMNLRLAPVEQRDISRTIRAYGTVTYAQDKEYSVNTKINGWIEKLYVNATGQRVRKGEPLLEIYSPELVSTQEEYLQTLDNMKKAKTSDFASVRKGAETLLSSARDRLGYWDIPEGEVKRLEEKRTVKRTVLLRAPNDGVVTHKNVVQGDKVMPGMDLFRIADLSTVWVEATIYENELPLIHVGQKVELVLDYISTGPIGGKVDFIYPYLDQKARAANVRMVFKNKNEILKPDMYATVRIFSKAATNALVIPHEAVIHSGERNIVFVEQKEGTFEPRQVTLGAESDDGYQQIISGLFPHERVVASGQFMLDSESQTREAIAKMRAARASAPAAPQGDEKQMDMDQSGHDHAMQEQNHDSAAHEGHSHETASMETKGDSLYACSMHPDYITSDPDGRCPDCGMKLTPVSELGENVKLDKATFYTCPMHPEFVTTDPDGKCPKCGMKLGKKE